MSAVSTDHYDIATLTALPDFLTATADQPPDTPDHSLSCHEEHGRCIRDATFQNCKIRGFSVKLTGKKSTGDR